MATVLKAMYFPDENIFTATQKEEEKKLSYAWKSILYGRDLVCKGIRYMIGDGMHISVWTDLWISDHPPRPRFHRYIVVEEDVEKSLSIKLCITIKLDLLGWHNNENGLYSVKSRYWLSIHLPTTV